MSFVSGDFTFGWTGATSGIIDVAVGTTDVECVDLYAAIKYAQESEEGMLYGQIGSGSGLVNLGPGVTVGLTVELLGSWQLRFPAGNYIARVAGGNLVGGPAGDPIAYSAGVQTLLIQSAAATVVTSSIGGTVPSAAQNAAATKAALEAAGAPLEELHRLQGLKASAPMTVTPTTRVAGDISLVLTGDGVTTTTVTRLP